MELFEGYEIVDLALYVKESKSLIISDLQLGYEESLNKKGIMVPRFQYKDIVKRLEKIFAMCKAKKYSINEFIINGDLKHEFGAISDQEWREILKLFDFIKKHCEKIIVVKGNHDMFLAPVVKKRDVSLVDEYIVGESLLVHGHEIPSWLECGMIGLGRRYPKSPTDGTEIKRIIIGHEHPALTLREGYSREQFKCFLKGKYSCFDLIVLPSFNPVIPGSDMLTEDRLSPFLADIKNFDAYVVEDEVYHFGKLKKLGNKPR